MADVYYSPKGLAETAGVSLATVRKAINEGRVTVIHADGRRVLIPASDTQARAWLADSDAAPDRLRRLRSDLARAERRYRQAEAALRKANRERDEALRKLDGERAGRAEDARAYARQVGEQSTRLFEMERTRMNDIVQALEAAHRAERSITYLEGAPAPEHRPGGQQNLG